MYKSYTSVKFSSKILFFLMFVIVNFIFRLFIASAWKYSWFYILVLYLVTLMNLFILEDFFWEGVLSRMRQPQRMLSCTCALIFFFIFWEILINRGWNWQFVQKYCPFIKIRIWERSTWKILWEMGFPAGFTPKFLSQSERIGSRDVNSVQEREQVLFQAIKEIIHI